MRNDLLTWAEVNPALAIAGVVLALGAVTVGCLLVWRLISKVRKAKRTEDALTYLAAGIATGVSATGMWRFSGDVLGFEGPLRVLLFGFIEIAVIASAVRARKAWRRSAKRIEEAKSSSWQQPSAGIDGKAVWVLTMFTAVCSAMDSTSPAEVVFRLAAPLVAAWLWHRGMAIERDEIMTRQPSRIAWKVTPERLLVRLGLADPTNRTAGDVAVERYLTRAALAAKRVRTLPSNASARTRRRVQRRYERAMDAAVEYAGVATDSERLDALGDRLRVLFNQADLPYVTFPAPWRQWAAEEVEEVEAVRVNPELDPDPEPGGGGRPVELSPAPVNGHLPASAVLPATPAQVPAPALVSTGETGLSPGDPGDPRRGGHPSVGDPAPGGHAPVPVPAVEGDPIPGDPGGRMRGGHLAVDDPAPGGHDPDPVPADDPMGDTGLSPGDPGDPTGEGHPAVDDPAPGGHDSDPVPLLQALPSKAAQVRAAITAVTATGMDLDKVTPADLVAYLTSQGVSLPVANAKTELKRERARRAAAAQVIQLSGVTRRTPGRNT